MGKNDQKQETKPAAPAAPAQPPVVAAQEEDAQPEGSEQPASGMVKLKILRAVGHYAEGQEVEVPMAVAEHLMAERKTNWGDHTTSYRCAVTMEEYSALKKAEKNPETGGRVVVQTPPDPALQARIDNAMAARKARAAQTETKK